MKILIPITNGLECQKIQEINTDFHIPIKKISGSQSSAGNNQKKVLSQTKQKQKLEAYSIEELEKLYKNSIEADETLT